jgi:hypothetical protein
MTGQSVTRAHRTKQTLVMPGFMPGIQDRALMRI